ncbi:MAG: FG-GAP repeat protein [Deltaproteobacteria bacterium]|nr:FG-GAP repeat protein [Deltaproteobacteria bacterium]
MRSLAPACAILAAVSGCGSPPAETAVVLAVSSDMAVPEQLARVEVTARIAAVSGLLREASAGWVLGPPDHALPLTSVYPAGDPPGDWIAFDVRGLNESGDVVVARDVWARFEHGRLVRIEVTLASACRMPTVTCATGTQCLDGECRPTDPPPDTGCGDGIQQGETEECDDGNTDDTDSCRSNCRRGRCGDGVVRREVEQCDDGNADDSDECRVTCQRHRCGDGTVRPGVEECDDGNGDDVDGCTTACVLARCGDGIVRADVEQCDGDAPQPCVTACGSTGEGHCEACRWVCSPPSETCDGRDDDCDTRVDEDFPCVRGRSTRCSPVCGTDGVGVCSSTCSLPLPADCAAPAEACNGADDDCDTVPDDGFPCRRGAVDPCITACGTQGTITCSPVCAPGSCLPPPDVCNGEDDDCDTACDEPAPCCAGSRVPCTTSCGSHGWGTCSPTCGAPSGGGCAPPRETCNGADDDCDGATDNVGGGYACGDGCCAGGESRCGCPADCGAPALPAPRPILPSFGAYTGSLLTPASADTLRPLFVWTYSDSGPCGSLSVEIQVDDSCSTPGFADCTFPSPEAVASGLDVEEWRPGADLEVDAAAPVGRRYYWRIRSCDAGGRCSAWSRVQYVDVGRAACDVNGDGYSDLVVGAPMHPVTMTGSGAVYVLPGSAAGLPASVAGHVDLPSPEFGGRFGNAVGCGDVNADGFDDLVVGAIGQSSGATSEGAAYVLTGSAAGIEASTAVRIDSPENQELSEFGISATVVGDVDGDGFADAAIGADREDDTEYEEGAVYLYHGSAGGLPVVPTSRVGCPGHVARSDFGARLAAAGDVDRDGYVDLAVGAPSYGSGATGEGNVFLFRGGPGGITGVPMSSLDCPGNQAGAAFGTALASGDVNGDGWLDLVVGAPAYDGPNTDEGRAWVYLGTASGLPSSPSITLNCPEDQARAAFGAGAALADVDGDGFADVLLGAILFDNPTYDHGAVFVFSGGAVGPGIAPTVMLPGPGVYGAPHFGEVIYALGDVDADGMPDVAVGAPRHSETGGSEGAVYVWRGEPVVGLSPSATWTYLRPYGTSANFGTAIACLRPLPCADRLGPQLGV